MYLFNTFIASRFQNTPFINEADKVIVIGVNCLILLIIEDLFQRMNTKSKILTSDEVTS